MVKFIRFKDSSVKLVTLKSRKFDFFRINPFTIARIGKRKLVKQGLMNKNQTVSDIPTENKNHFVSNSFIIHWDKTKFTDGNIHIGFTVTIKTISKRANIRNLVKRRLKYAINELIRDYNVAGYDFVITARTNSLITSFDDIKKEFKKSLKFIEHRIKENLTS